MPAITIHRELFGGKFTKRQKIKEKMLLKSALSHWKNFALHLGTTKNAQRHQKD
jgi:hypothetical protein